MVKNQRTAFQIYRYQILPVSNSIQLSLFDESITTIDELKARKNEIFWQELTSLKELEYSRGDLNFVIDGIVDNVAIMSINCKKTIKVPTKNFTETNIEMWPPIHVGINNDPEIQKIVISVNNKAFQSSKTVAKIITENMNQVLIKHNLSIFIKPIYEASEFWHIVDKYENLISQVRFELISPNMSNISSSLKIDLHELHKNTNTVKTNLELNSPDDSTLQIKRSDELIESLANYSSQGGGDVSLKIKGLSKRLKTAKKLSEISFDEAEIKGSPGVVLDTLKGLTKT